MKEPYGEGPASHPDPESCAVGREAEGEAFAELLSHWDGGSLTDVQKKDIEKRSVTLREQVRLKGEHLTRWRFWHWLMQMAQGYSERHTVSII